MDITNRTAFGIKLLIVSLGLGIVGDFLLGNDVWGLSLPLFAGLLVLQVLLVAKFSKSQLPRETLLLLLAAFAFSLCFLWRDAPELKALNGLAFFALVGLAAMRAPGQRPITFSVADIGFKALGMWFLFVASFCSLAFVDVKWAEAIKQRGMSGVGSVARGLIIAVPLLLIFGGLLVSADASFQAFFRQFSAFDGGAVLNHLYGVAGCMILVGGLLRQIFIEQKVFTKSAPHYMPYVMAPLYHPPYRSREPLRLGAMEIGIILGSLNALFGLFVIIQAPYLFGGAKHVLTTEHLSFADYARRGFFELVLVVGLAIPVLLGSHALLKAESKSSERLWRVMAVVMVSLLLVVMHSAVDRMRLYVDLYSLSTQRVYVLASLGWMALMLLWFLLTTVRGRSDRFAFGAFVALLATILGVNAINPDATVVEYNVALATPGKVIDGQYLRSLSDDARPMLIRYAAKLDPDTRASMKEDWMRKEKEQKGQWRSWTWSRSVADAALRNGGSRLGTAPPDSSGAGLQASRVGH